jgi:alkanesulfonate monooxygenase SsuD/methylene tetrahydromethanopterin reductase-like flavin-dependent oxidoreductase (luciferase family)
LFFPTSGGVDTGLLERYRTEFVPTPDLAEPQAILAVSVICAETSAAARGIDDELTRRGYHPSNVVGGPAHCRSVLLDLARRHAVSEIVIATWPTEFETRARTYELIARAFRRQTSP